MFCATRLSNLILLIPGIGCYSKTRRIALKVAVAYYNTINMLQKKNKLNFIQETNEYILFLSANQIVNNYLLPNIPHSVQNHSLTTDSKENYKIRRLPLQFYNLFIFIINSMSIHSKSRNICFYIS